LPDGFVGRSVLDEVQFEGTHSEWISFKSSIPVKLSLRNRSRPKLPGERSSRVNRFSRPSELATIATLHHLVTVDGVQTQALLRSNLDEKHWRRSVRLIRKISKARGIIPSSYTVQEEYIHAWNIQYDRGFTELSDGEYQGRNVAIKRLKVDHKDPDKTFKVWYINLANHPYSGFT
jgi:hypothetical protein